MKDQEMDPLEILKGRPVMIITLVQTDPLGAWVSYHKGAANIDCQGKPGQHAMTVLRV